MKHRPSIQHRLRGAGYVCSQSVPFLVQEYRKGHDTKDAPQHNRYILNQNRREYFRASARVGRKGAWQETQITAI